MVLAHLVSSVQQAHDLVGALASRTLGAVVTRDWDAVWLAFKLVHCDTVGISHNRRGGMIHFIRKDAHVPNRLFGPESLVGRSMAALGIEPTPENYHMLVEAARRDK